MPSFVTASIYTLALGIGAFLLFWIQPLVGKTLLPLLGGAPAVWMVCMLFFQTVLLAGYLYTHLGVVYLGPRRFMYVHIGMLLVSLLWLPFYFESTLTPPASEHPGLWLFGLMLLKLGVPAITLSATAPLLQNWFGYTKHKRAQRPYFLYAISNVGSLLGLALFPFVLEPAFNITEQYWLWAVGFGTLTLLCLAASRLTKLPKTIKVADGSKISWKEKLAWCAMSFVPCGLMLASTTSVAIDLGSFPLLWIVTLGLYLITFIIAFAKTYSPAMINRMGIVGLLAVCMVAVSLMNFSGLALTSKLMIIKISCMFIIALAIHMRLAASAPNKAYLTHFYLWMSLGGALAGLFNSLVAPLAFDRFVELHVFLVGAALMLPLVVPQNRWKWITVASVIGCVISLVVLSLVIYNIHSSQPIQLMRPSRWWLFAAPIALLFAMSTHRYVTRFVLVAIVLSSPWFIRNDPNVVMQSRNFFGIHKVVDVPYVKTRILFNGTTLHGAQLYGDGQLRTLTSYYHESGPLGQAMNALPHLKNPETPLAFVGLGVGTVACYGVPGQKVVFFEIDPAVYDIAKNPSYFSFLDSCDPQSEVRIVDGRLGLLNDTEHKYGAIVVDAFSSDAIPVHLITDEAVQLFMNRIDDMGLVLFHISNRYYDLMPVLARIAEKNDYLTLFQSFVPAAGDRMSANASEWVVFAKSPKAVAHLISYGKVCPSTGFRENCWQEVQTHPNVGLWTDQFSSPLSALFHFTRRHD